VKYINLHFNSLNHGLFNVATHVGKDITKSPFVLDPLTHDKPITTHSMTFFIDILLNASTFLFLVLLYIQTMATNDDICWSFGSIQLLLMSSIST
jgi:hypothetical protein